MAEPGSGTLWGETGRAETDTAMKVKTERKEGRGEPADASARGPCLAEESRGVDRHSSLEGGVLTDDRRYAHCHKNNG